MNTSRRPVEAYEDTEAVDFSEMDPHELQEYAKRHKLDEGPRIVVPRDRTDMERATKARPCLTCIHFDLAAGQKAAVEQNFWQDLMDKQSQNWSRTTLGQVFRNPGSFGLCLAFSSERQRLVDGYSPGTCRTSDFDSTVPKGAPEDKTVPCTEWSPKDEGRQKKLKGRWGL